MSLVDDRQPMRISVMCGGSRVFGLERMALAVMDGLRKRGHSVHCLVSTWGDGDFPARLKAIGVPYSPIPLGKLSLALRRPYLWWTVDALIHLPIARKRCREHLTTFQPSVVIFYDRDWMVLNDRSVQAQPTIFHVQGLPSEKAPGESRLDAWRNRRLDRRTSAYATISESVRQGLVRLGIDASKTALIYNGIAPTEASSVCSNSNEKPVIGIVGQVAPWKGHDDLIEALRLLQESGDEFLCRIFGAGEEAYARSLTDKIERHGLTRLVQWCGYLRSTDEIFRQIDICVVPSRFEEPFGLVAAEAGLRRIPVVATRRGGLPEVITDGETGKLVNSESPGELAAAVRQLLRSPHLRQQLGEAARERVLVRFGQEKMIDEVEALCLRLANPLEQGGIRPSVVLSPATASAE